MSTRKWLVYFFVFFFSFVANGPLLVYFLYTLTPTSWIAFGSLALASVITLYCLSVLLSKNARQM